MWQSYRHNQDVIWCASSMAFLSLLCMNGISPEYAFAWATVACAYTTPLSQSVLVPKSRCSWSMNDCWFSVFGVYTCRSGMGRVCWTGGVRPSNSTDTLFNAAFRKRWTVRYKHPPTKQNGQPISNSIADIVDWVDTSSHCALCPSLLYPPEHKVRHGDCVSKAKQNFGFVHHAKDSFRVEFCAVHSAQFDIGEATQGSESEYFSNDNKKQDSSEILCIANKNYNVSPQISYSISDNEINRQSNNMEYFCVYLRERISIPVGWIKKG